MGSEVNFQQQTVDLNGETSKSRSINSGIPQGLALRPLLFLIYIYDIPNGITSIYRILADDTSIFPKFLI